MHLPSSPLLPPAAGVYIIQVKQKDFQRNQKNVGMVEAEKSKQTRKGL